MPTSNTVNDRLRSFIYKQFPIASQRRLGDEDALLDSGVVDSLGILEIVNFVEEEFKISVGDEELVPENFNTIDQLKKFIELKMGA